MRRAGLTALGITIGWFVRGKHDLDSGRHESTPSAIGSIEGCIEVGGALWRGTAHLSGDQVKEVKVPYKPLCPNCQTIIYDHEKESKPSTLATTYWDCPSCGYQTEKSINKYHDTEKIFDTKFKQIVESEGKEYSHENLTGSDPEEIWKNYAELVDDNQTSTNCFH